MNVINKDSTTTSHNKQCCNCKYHFPKYNDDSGFCEYDNMLMRTWNDHYCKDWEKAPMFCINNRVRFMDKLSIWWEKYRNVYLFVIFLLFVGMIRIVG